MGLTDFLKNIFGKKSDRDMRSLMPFVYQINEEYDRIKTLSNDELRNEANELRNTIKAHIKEKQDEIAAIKKRLDEEELSFTVREELYDKIDDIEDNIDEQLKVVLDESLPKAFAIVKDTARRFKENEKIEVTANDFDKDLAAERESIKINNDKATYYNKWIAGGNEITWDMVHYDVQLIGGVVLHQGKIAEMATGEGKTLAATLPVFLNALTGRGVHIITVNDYLAKRDAEWMGPMFEFHGLSVDCIDKHQPNSEQRRKAYAADITYGTNNEFGFDYLRDNMAFEPSSLVQREHVYSIIDEVDSVLIDDARTPLIISGPVPRGEKQLFDEFKPKIAKLVAVQRKLVTQILADAKRLIKEGNKDNKGAILLLRAFKGLPKNKALIKYLSEPGIKTMLLKTEDVYLAENAKRMPEITDELFFVIDEKTNSVDLTDKGHDLITQDTDDPNFFVLPDIGKELAEIENSTLSAKEKIQKKDELLADYAVKTERVHTTNQLLKAYAMFEKDVEYVVIDNKVKIVDEQTGRIMEGRRYSDGLHQAIEAKENVKVEAATQTFATVTLQNYFRMYKKLAGMTGTAETEAGEFWDIYKLDVVVIPTNLPIIREDREDLVYKTKREKYQSVIEEVVELVAQGRPVLVGTTSVEVSELLSRMLKMKGMKHNVLNAKLHQREADIVAEAGKPGTITIATNMAGRGTDIKLTPDTREAGGLAIIGTERHESRRVDRQLRGRSGRQGDPGSSQFFVSLEDDLMRLFQSERIAKLMDRMGLEEGEVIQHSMISKSIERAQKRVEENNFGIRKRLLEYDDVMNSQREAIYKKRHYALFGERIGVQISNMITDVCESIVEQHYGISTFDEFNFDLIRYFSIESPIDERQFIKENPQDIVEEIRTTVIERYKRKSEIIVEQARPVINDVYKTSSHVYKNISVPISDGTKIYNIPVNLEKAFESDSKEVMRAFERAILLNTIDDLWKEHLRELDDLKQSVQNASYEQKDPLLVYKLESFNLFKGMLDKNNKQVVSTLLKAHIPIQDSSEVRQAKERKQDYSQYNETKSEAGSSIQGGGQGGDTQVKEKKKVQTVRRGEKKVGRNEPCPCGSGKKYKHCHGKKG